MSSDFIARGLATAQRRDLASTGAGMGAALIGLEGGGTVRDHIQWVTPEAFGAIGNGSAANAARDTAALQQAVASGRPVKLRPGANYQINAEITPPNGVDLTIAGHRNSGDKQTVLTAVAGFKGWMLRPRGAYDIRDVKLNGNGAEGCYLIGSPDNLSVGIARIERVYLANADIGIFFDADWEHPWGLYYNQIVGTSFRTGGINLGGVAGTASSGESAWTMDNININGSPTGIGISASEVAVATNTPDATHDTITWNNASSPLYGWCVMRSLDGSTGWHVPPNWSSTGLNAATFTAQKAAGETWQYAVVRMTRGVSIRRAKAIWAGVIQAEYFGIGVYFSDVPAVDIRQIYAETRDRTPPLPQLCGIAAFNSHVSVGGGWVEQYGYALLSLNNSRMNVTGPLRANNCRWGKGALGGSTAQSLRHFGDLNATGTTLNRIAQLTGSAYEYIAAGAEQDANGGMTIYADGVAGSSLSVRRRGVDKGRLYVNAASEGQLDCERLKQTQPSKTALVPLANRTQGTALTPGTATGFLTISGLPINSAAAMSFLVQIVGRDPTSTVRQSSTCRVDVVLTDSGSSGVTAALSASPAAGAVQSGTLGDPAFTVAVAGGIATLSCNVASSMASLALYATPIAGATEAQSLTITQL
ncbi:hypothetical protein [Novosphingobium gossypii]|uniref:hypothetical protein n=1 Tax=Novosphingobium gossypii TaxID=1604774 RepID=UPI003D1D66A4